MRDRNKSELGRAFKSRLSEDDSGTVSRSGRVVVDGGWMLYQVDWKSCTTYGDLADKFVPLIQGLSKGCEKVLVVFDGYQSSPKDHEHRHRHNLSCADLEVKHDSKILVDRTRFVSNGRNNEALIQLLMSRQPNSLRGVKCEKSNKDADTLLVRLTLSECDKTSDAVVVHGNDTDLLMLFLFHGHMHKNLFFDDVEICKHWGALSEGEKDTFLVAYALTSFETVSSLFGKGKAAV